MRKFSIVIYMLVALLGAGCREKFTSGEAAVQGACVKCHKINGKGGKKGPELTHILDKYDEDYVRTYILNPRSIKPDGTMPPSKLSDEEVGMVIQYLRAVHESAPPAKP